MVNTISVWVGSGTMDDELGHGKKEQMFINVSFQRRMSQIIIKYTVLWSINLNSLGRVFF